MKLTTLFLLALTGLGFAESTRVYIGTGADGIYTTMLNLETGSDDGKLKKIHETITAQQPDEATLKILKEGLASFKQSKDEQFAWTMIVHTLLNQDSFKNKE
ncbi:hypothetical protein OAE92_02030 [Akkermansiaceae bacterium]|nr:hypothetical protein [Akkermansiaceae bacterium]